MDFPTRIWNTISALRNETMRQLRRWKATSSVGNVSQNVARDGAEDPAKRAVTSVAPSMLYEKAANQGNQAAIANLKRLSGHRK
jgi:hypothetical protein